MHKRVGRILVRVARAVGTFLAASSGVLYVISPEEDDWR